MPYVYLDNPGMFNISRRIICSENGPLIAYSNCATYNENIKFYLLLNVHIFNWVSITSQLLGMYSFQEISVSSMTTCVVHWIEKVLCAVSDHWYGCGDHSTDALFNFEGAGTQKVTSSTCLLHFSFYHTVKSCTKQHF